MMTTKIMPINVPIILVSYFSFSRFPGPNARTPPCIAHRFSAGDPERERRKEFVPEPMLAVDEAIAVSGFRRIPSLRRGIACNYPDRWYSLPDRRLKQQTWPGAFPGQARGTLVKEKPR
jgi:hypothetical protein